MMWIRYALIICSTAVFANISEIAQGAAIVEMQCPKVRDYGGYPHTTGETITYRLDRSNQTVSRGTNSGWLTICEGTSQCSIQGDEVLFSEMRTDEKKLIDRHLNFSTFTEKAKEWGNLSKTKLVFGYESRCKPRR